MKTKVRTFECDKCGTTENVKEFNEIPTNWLELSGQVDSAYAFELDLCPKCAARVLRSLEKELK